MSQVIGLHHEVCKASFEFMYKTPTMAFGFFFTDYTQKLYYKTSIIRIRLMSKQFFQSLFAANYEVGLLIMSNIYNTGSYFLHETLRYMMVVLIIIKLNFMFGLIF